MTRVLTIHDAEAFLRRAGWKESVIVMLLKPPVPATIQCGDTLLVVKR